MTKTEYNADPLHAGAAPLDELLAFREYQKQDIRKAASGIVPIYSHGRLIGYGETADVQKSGSLVNMDQYEALAGDNSCFDSLGIFTNIADMQRADIEKSAEHEPEQLSEDAWLFDSCFPPVIGCS